MDREKEIDRIMSEMPENYRKRWCEPGDSGCSCMGCANVAGRQYGKVTKVEWIAWKQRNTEGEET